MSCKPWVILSAYGTDESSDDQHRWGDIGVNNWYIWGIKKALAKAGYGSANLDGNGYVLPDATVDIRNLDYPAAPDAWPVTFTSYWDSMYQGRDEVVKDVRWYSENCGANTTVILVGYSQGAEVVKNALSTPGLQAVESKIGAIVDIADPSRSNDQVGMSQDGQMVTLNPDMTPGTVSLADGGLFERRSVPGVFTGFIDGGQPRRGRPVWPGSEPPGCGAAGRRRLGVHEDRGAGGSRKRQCRRRDGRRERPDAVERGDLPAAGDRRAASRRRAVLRQLDLL